MIDKTKINDIVLRIANSFNPEQIILFGSYAKGTPNKDSDLDLLIIQDTDLPRQKRGLDIRMSLIGTKVPMDILVYTKSEFENEKNEKYSFILLPFKENCAHIGSGITMWLIVCLEVSGTCFLMFFPTPQCHFTNSGT